MKKLFTLGLLLLAQWPLLAQVPQVPATMQFADLKLEIKEGARRQIQADVDALHRNRSYFDRKLAKVDLYFPIIERVFREENLPDDFKYLVIQESALVPDAVSSSNAIGFWQFKVPAAEEVGLRIDRQIDERMNIVSATRGAARYLKKNNSLFDNWLHALLAYNMGPGGANKEVGTRHNGARKMVIDGSTHWYIKKFLAHKVAFEYEIGRNFDSGMQLQEYTHGADKTLEEIAQELGTDHSTVLEYNKWLRKGRIPSDRTYTVVIPVAQPALIAQKEVEQKQPPANESKNKWSVFSYRGISTRDYDFGTSSKYPQVKDRNTHLPTKINGIPGVMAQTGDTPKLLAELGGISIQKLEKYNDMTSGAKVATDHPYYFKRKKNKASIHFHVVQPNESMWGIAQKYGLKLKKLRMKNRMGEQEKAEAGRVLWLRFIRPADIPVEYQKTQAPAPAAKPVPVDKKQLIQSSGQPSVQKPAQEEEPFFEFEESAGQSAPQPSHEDDIKSFRELTPAIQKETKALNEGAGNAINSGKPTHHSVATSETLYGIAQQYSVSVQDLERWNPGIQHAPLKVGQAVKIFSPEHENGAALEPMHDISSGQYAVHVVQPGETLYGIARMHDVSIKEIMEWNGKADFTIKTGESLRIKNK